MKKSRRRFIYQTPIFRIGNSSLVFSLLLLVLVQPSFDIDVGGKSADNVLLIIYAVPVNRMHGVCGCTMYVTYMSENILLSFSIHRQMS